MTCLIVRKHHRIFKREGSVLMVPLFLHQSDAVLTMSSGPPASKTLFEPVNLSVFILGI
jgi:hypothetical protein